MVYTSHSRIGAFFSVICCTVSLYSAHQVTHDPIHPFLKNLAFSLVARSIDDPVMLASLSVANKGIYAYMVALHKERCNEFKNYVADKKHGMNPDAMVYAPSKLRAYYLVNGGAKDVESTELVSLSHYGNAYQKKVITNFANLSFYTAKLAERFKPRMIGDACYMYDTYAEEEEVPGTFVRVLYTGTVEYAYAYCTFHDEHASTGWIATFLPKLHDELIKHGACIYYPWNACTKGGLKKIKKDFDKTEGHRDLTVPYTGVLVFNGNSLTSISPKDKEMLYCMTPKMRDDIDANGLVGVTPYSNNSGNYLFSRSSLIHMHVSWGMSDAIVQYLHGWKPVCYTVHKYGAFTAHPFTEEILFEPYAKWAQRVKNGVKQFFLKKQKPTVILQQADKRCPHALTYLGKNKAFVSKDWLANGKALSEKLHAFYDSRYTFSHNDKYVLVYDTIRSYLYVISLAQNKVPTIQIIPNIKEEDYALTSSGYTVEYQPDSIHD